jgi:2-dehydro-3-deoxygalactonokinase
VSDIKLIGLDWGSTNVRAFAFDTDGGVIDRAHSASGAMTLSSAAAFDAALVQLVGAWQSCGKPAPMIACGMVGARGGWIEAGYCAINADARTLRCALKSVDTSIGAPLRIVPGLKSDAPDVTRGEETQIIGADVSDGVLVLPGTHSKWATVRSGKISSFATFFTGEMNALIRSHSTVGKAISVVPNIVHDEAILRGVSRATSSANWLNDLFGFRARVVTSTIGEEDASSEFSAWLIASEFVQARAIGFHTATIYVLASDSLLPWYQRIARAFNIEVKPINGDEAAARGLWRIAGS